jgi:molecular chaperone GrpE
MKDDDQKDTQQDDIAPEPGDEPVDVLEEDEAPGALELLTQEVEQEKSRRLQLMADFENFRRRMEDERAKFGLLANRMLVGGVLEVLDDVQMAQNDKGLDLDRAKSLFTTFSDKLLGILRLNGVEKIEIKPGDDFDAATMEAITTVPGDKDNKVVDVVSSAYRYAGKEELLQTAKVVVSKKK